MAKEDGLHPILQHRRLLDVLQSIEECVGSTDAEYWRSEAEQRLGELVGLLEKHFAVEVATTFPDLRAQRDPARAEQVARLDAEHPVLLAQFRRVRQMLSDPNVTQPEVERAVRRASGAFRRHEARENELFLDLY